MNCPLDYLDHAVLVTIVFGALLLAALMGCMDVYL